MPKSSRFRKFPKLNLYLIIAILIVVTALIGFYFKHKSSNTLTDSKYCPAIVNFYTTAKSAWPKNNIIQDLNKDADPQANLYFHWRTSEATPFFGFPGDRTINFILPNRSFDSVDSTFQAQVLPTLQTKDYAINSLNTFPAYSSSTVELQRAMYGFTKDNQKFNVWIETSQYYVSNNEPAELPNPSVILSITCGSFDPKYQKVYADIESVKPHPIRLNTPTELQTTVDIWDLIDNVARVNIGNIAGFGSGEYWDLSKNPPQLLLGPTQEQPPCSVFESRKVGKGLDCRDFDTSNIRPAKY